MANPAAPYLTHTEPSRDSSACHVTCGAAEGGGHALESQPLPDAERDVVAAQGEDDEWDMRGKGLGREKV